jgi:hypothetical protein
LTFVNLCWRFDPCDSLTIFLDLPRSSAIPFSTVPNFTRPSWTFRFARFHLPISFGRTVLPKNCYSWSEGACWSAAKARIRMGEEKGMGQITKRWTCPSSPSVISRIYRPQMSCLFNCMSTTSGLVVLARLAKIWFVVARCDPGTMTWSSSSPVSESWILSCQLSIRGTEISSGHNYWINVSSKSRVDIDNRICVCFGDTYKNIGQWIILNSVDPTIA